MKTSKLNFYISFYQNILSHTTHKENMPYIIKCSIVLINKKRKENYTSTLLYTKKLYYHKPHIKKRYFMFSKSSFVLNKKKIKKKEDTNYTFIFLLTKLYYHKPHI